MPHLLCEIYSNVLSDSCLLHADSEKCRLSLPGPGPFSSLPNSCRPGNFVYYKVKRVESHRQKNIGLTW